MDPYTVGLLCYGMGHWFGAWDIIDAAFPERSVMNYRDRTGGWGNGRGAWDRANRAERLRFVGTR